MDTRDTGKSPYPSPLGPGSDPLGTEVVRMPAQLSVLPRIRAESITRVIVAMISHRSFGISGQLLLPAQLPPGLYRPRFFSHVSSSLCAAYHGDRLKFVIHSSTPLALISGYYPSACRGHGDNFYDRSVIFSDRLVMIRDTYALRVFGSLREGVREVLRFCGCGATILQQQYSGSALCLVSASLFTSDG